MPFDFDPFFHRYHPVVCRLAKYFVLCPYWAEDITSILMLELYSFLSTNADSVEVHDFVKTRFSEILHQQHIQINGVRLNIPVDYRKLNDPVVVPETNNLRSLMRIAIDRLPKSFRLVCKLYYCGGLSICRIRKHLLIPETTIRHRLAQGTFLLKKQCR